MDGYIHSMNQQHTDAMAAHKQRIRWIPELHELFLNAVDQLGGPDRENTYINHLLIDHRDPISGYSFVFKLNKFFL